MSTKPHRTSLRITVGGRCLAILAAILVMTLCVSCRTPVNTTGGQDAIGEQSFVPSLPPEAFRDVKILTPKQAEDLALSRNPSLKAMAARIEQARAIVSQATAAYWPQVRFNGEAGHLDLAETAELPGSSVDDPDWRYSVGVSASYVVFDGFRRRFIKAAARHGEAISELALADARRLTASAVATAYCNAQFAQANRRIQQADLDFFAAQVKDAELRQKAGNGRESDTLGFRVRVNAAQAALLNAKLEQRTARLALAALLGARDLPEGVAISPLKPATKAELQQPEQKDLLQLARRQRPDLKAASEAVAGARARIGVARADHMPTVELFGSYGGERGNDARFERDDFGYYAGARLTFKVFDGWLTRGRVKEARAAEEELRHEAQRTALRIETEVRQRRAALLTMQQQVDLQRRNLALVTRTRDLVKTEYAKGQASLVRLNEAQRDWTAAESRLALARTRLRLAWSELRASIGGELPLNTKNQR